MPHRRMPYVADGLLFQPATAGLPATPVGSAAWYAWLDEPATHSFAFHDPAGHFTARKERRKRGGIYWSAYRTSGGKTASVYLGTSGALTLERLQAAGTRLAARARQLAPPSPSEAETRPSAPPLPRLTRPPIRPDLIPRPRLLARLDAGQRLPLTLISAPAGFGKTTALNLWLQTARPTPVHDTPRERAAATSAEQTVWLTSGPAIDDPCLLLRTLVDALHAVIRPTSGSPLESLLVETRPPPLELVVADLLQHLSASPQRVVLILDDYHTLTHPEVHRALALLVEQLPLAVRLVVASRDEPPLPLARWRARGLLAELHAADLRFTTAEAAAFLRETMGLTLSDADVAALTERTEGWAAGLQLAALALQEQPDPSGFIAAFAGDNRLVVDYLSAEVLAALPAHLQQFLLQTAILDQLSGPLCDAVVLGEAPAASGAYSQPLLDELERRNLFLTPIDLTRSWYRYHPLFREVLQRRLSYGAAPDVLACLHRRAASWFAAQGSPQLIAPALRHMLAAGAADEAVTMVLRHAPALLRRLEPALLRDWLAIFPTELLQSHTRLALVAGWSLTLTGQLGAALALLDEATALQPPLAPPAAVAEADLIRAMNARLRGDLLTAQALLARALPAVDPADPDACTWAAYLRGFTALDDEDQASARAALEEAVRLGADAGQVPLALSALSRLALTALRSGELTRARRSCDQADALVVGATIPAAGLADVVRGMIAYQRNDLGTAQRALEQGVGRLRGWIDYHVLVLGMRAQARCLQALGESEAAHDVLTRAEAWLAQRRIQGPGQAQIAAERVRLWLHEGRLDEAVHWGEGELPAVPPLHSGLLQLTLVRLWLAQAHADGARDRLDTARPILGALREAALRHGWNGDLSEAELLEAQILALQGEVDVAVERVSGVLARLEPEGAVRQVADEGRHIIPLLRQVAATHRALRPFVQRILRAVGPAGVTQTVFATDDEREALTARETEVLRLLGEGQATAAIAAQLFISQGTVKRHIGNILRKLEARSRLEAVAKARACGLL